MAVEALMVVSYFTGGIKMDAPNYVPGLYSVAQRDAIFAKADKYPDAANGLQNQVPTIFPDGSIGWRQIPEGGDGTANANIAVVESTQYASHDYTYGNWLIYNDQLYRVIAPIRAGDELNQSNLKSITVGGFVLTPIGKGKNLLRNWFFKGGGSQQGGGQYPINQRGLTSYTAVGGTIDGWFQTGGTTTVSANFIQHVSPANESSDFYQIVDLPYASDIYTDMSLTFSAVAASRFRYGTAVINSDLLTETVVVSYNSFQLILQLILPDKIKATIRVFAGETVTMSMAKLEFGQRQTLMSDLGTPPTWDAPPDYQTELLRCSDGFTPLVGKGVNLLDNAYFIGGGTAGAFPINQRGNTTGTVSTEGFIDRWILNGSYNLYANSLWLSQGSFFSQKIDPALGAFLNGKMVTVSLLHADGTLDTGSAVYVASPSQNVNFFRGTKCYACLIGGNPNQLYFVQDGGNVGVVAAKLELGSRQTLARQVNGAWVLNDPPPNYQQELAKCQRYLLYGWQILGRPHCVQGSTAYSIFELPVSMARQPDILGTLTVMRCSDNTVLTPSSPPRIAYLAGHYSQAVLEIPGISDLCYAYITNGGLSAE